MKAKVLFPVSVLACACIFSVLFFISGCGTVSSSSDKAPIITIVYLHAFGQVHSGPLSSEVMSMRSDGTDVVQLTQINAPRPWADRPAMSQDGTKVAYIIEDSNGSTLEVMDINGDNRSVVAETVSGRYFFCWSPDSKKLAFVDDDSEELYLRDIETMDPAVLVTGEVYAPLYLSWSADGGRIAYCDMGQNLWLVNVVGTTVGAFEKTDISSVAYPLFSPSLAYKDLIAFRSGVGISLADISSAPYQVVTLEADDVLYANMAWSPDGQWLYYCKFAGTAGYDIFRVKKDGTGKEDITGDLAAMSSAKNVKASLIVTQPHEYSPRFFPGTGKRMFFTAISPDGTFNSAEVYAMDPGGQNKTRLTDNDLFDALNLWEID